MVECFDPAVNQCRLTRHCRLQGVLAEATQRYLAALDAVTLADLVAPVAVRTAGGAEQPVRWHPGLPDAASS